MEVQGKRSVNHGSKLLCNPCEDDGNNTNANGFCLQCEEFMCTTCFDKHKRRRISKNHTLVPVHEAVLTTGLNEPEQFEKCEQHLNEIIKFYCPKHEQVGCGDCMILVHKSCKVEYIRDIAKTFKDNREFKELVISEKYQTEAKTVSTAIECNKKQTRDINNKFIGDVQKFSDRIISRVNVLKDSAIKQAESMQTKDIDNLDNIEKENEEFMKQMTCFMALFESQIDQPNKLFVSYVHEKAKLKRLQESYEGIRKKNSIKNYQFKPDANLTLAVNEWKELGSLKKAEQDADVKDIHVPDRAVSKASVQSKQVMAASRKQLLIERKMVCRNIAIDGEYLSYDGDGTDVGLYIYEPQDCMDFRDFFFEVEVVNTGQRGEIVIGVVPKFDYPANLPPGWGNESVGYNTNDGKLYKESRKGRDFGPKCNAGDKLGCSCQLVSNNFPGRTYKVVFTRNRKQIGEVIFQSIIRPCPAIGLQSNWERVKVIFDTERSG